MWNASVTTWNKTSALTESSGLDFFQDCAHDIIRLSSERNLYFYLFIFNEIRLDIQCCFNFRLLRQAS